MDLCTAIYSRISNDDAGDTGGMIAQEAHVRALAEGEGLTLPQWPDRPE